MRDIRTMFDVLKKDASNFAGIYQDLYGRDKPCFNLDLELTLTLVSGYDIALRHRVVTRLGELEDQARKPVTALSRLDLLKLAIDSEEQRLQLEIKVVALAPKAEALDRLALADGSFCIRDAAKTPQVQEKVLKQTLIERRWLYRRPMGSGYLAYSDKLQQGLVEHKVTQGDHATKAMDAAITAQQWATQAQPREAMESSSPR